VHAYDRPHAPGLPLTLLEPELLARLQGLPLRARTVAEGVVAGLHKSPHHGRSVEFAEHKEYAPGDDVKRIDWKAYGRRDRYYVRRYEDETNLAAYLVVDASASMGYGEPLSKIEYAKILAATLCHLLIEQRDRAGVLCFSDRVRLDLPPRSGASHLGDIVRALEAVEAGGQTDLPAALDAVAARAKRADLVVILSDLLSVGPAGVDRARLLATRRCDVAVLHVLHPDELSLPFEGTLLFEEPEQGRRVMADPDAVRTAYLREVERFQEDLRTRFAEARVEYRLANAGLPPEQTLVPFLAERARGR
jgi:uncharacterized protein (DUF58 family)